MPASAHVPVPGRETKYTGHVQLRYNYRLYPSAGQRAALARAFGCARVVFNDGLRVREQAHEAGLPYVTDRELSARLTAVKAAPERAWLADVSAVILQQSLADLNTAYRNFFASVTSAHGRSARWTRGLLYCGLAAGPVFITAFLVEGASREGYRPSRHPVSSLALGPRGWVQAANFAVTGTLVLADAAGVWRTRDPALGTRVGQALIGAAGAGLIGAAVFATDPVSGYPPGTPDELLQPSRTGIVHNLAAVPVFVGLPAAAFTCSWRSFRIGQRGFGLYCAATATTMLTTMVLAGAGFNQSPRLVNLAGLFQRASIVTGFGWLAALSARALMRAPATQARNPSA